MTSSWLVLEEMTAGNLMALTHKFYHTRFVKAAFVDPGSYFVLDHRSREGNFMSVKL